MVVVQWAEKASGILLIDTQGQWRWDELGQALDGVAVMLTQITAPIVGALALRHIQLAPGFCTAATKLAALKLGGLVMWGETLDSWFAIQVIREVAALPYSLYPVREVIDLIPCAVTILNAVLPIQG